MSVKLLLFSYPSILTCLGTQKKRLIEYPQDKFWLRNNFQLHTLRPNKKISVFRVKGLKILGRVCTHFFFNHFFSGKKYIFLHFERHFAFQNA